MDYAKLLSARFLATVSVITTFCVLVLIVVASAVTKGLIEPSLKDLTMLLIGAFISNVSTITTFYFMRADRNAQVTEPTEKV